MSDGVYDVNMRKLFYMGLESYEARYTLQLQEWNERFFKEHGIDYEIIGGEELDNSKAIVTGSVLDHSSFFVLSSLFDLDCNNFYHVRLTHYLLLLLYCYRVLRLQ
jgi:hypothetical protein